tara:strand:- start:32 stop:631 length:600 start_codon:yes stop_codon:yes gene_type:complete
MIYKFDIQNNIYEKLLQFSKDNSLEYNLNLVGNIKEEYSLLKYAPFVEPFILDELLKIDSLVSYFKDLKIMHPFGLNLKLSDFWVNYQKKHEFNPFHNHSGIFSFILFIKIPFLCDQEKLISPGLKSNGDKAGKLSFFYLNSDVEGGISEKVFDVDKNWEKKGLIFKSNLNHMVYPFFSEGERITMSGNLSFNTTQIKR